MRTTMIGTVQRRARRLIVTALALAAGETFAAAGSDYSAAERAAKEGRLADMQQANEAILADAPGETRALLGRAAALAWQGQYTEAQQTYRDVLAQESGNVDALTGLGYAEAWQGDHNAARSSFARAVEIDAARVDAHKGIAYTFLWSQRYDEALAAFDVAARHAPGDAEIWEARGKALLLAGRNRDAISAFDQALEIEPDRAAASAARVAAWQSAPVFEIGVVAGTTSDAGSGLRRAELAHALSAATRVALRYDNSLGLDNVSIADRGDDAQGYFAAIEHRLRSGVVLGGEVGQRDHVGGEENILALQAALPVASGMWRTGVRLGDHEFGHTNTVLFTGFGFPLSDDWRLEPVIYASQTGATGDEEWRAVFNVEHRVSDRLTAVGFVGTGQVDSAIAAFDGATTLFGGWLRYDTGRYGALTVALRRESTPARDFTIAEFGFVYRLPRN